MSRPGSCIRPAMSADGAELEALGRAVARHDAVFALHMRNYADRLVDAVEEALAVGRATGCRLQLSHLAVAGRRSWGSVARALERVDRARADGLDVGVDIYPYLAGSANLSQLLPGWAQEGGSVAVTARLADPQVRARIREEWVTTLHLGWDEIRVSLVDDDLQDQVLGRTIEEAGEQMGMPADAAALELIARTEDPRPDGGLRAFRGGPAVAPPRVGSRSGRMGWRSTRTAHWRGAATSPLVRVLSEAAGAGGSRGRHPDAQAGDPDGHLDPGRPGVSTGA